MTRLVVDANVAIKWVLPEEHSEAACSLLSESLELRAPDLFWAESGNILWKKWRRKELTAEAVVELLPVLRRFPLRILPSEPLCDLAWDVARRFDRSFYDSLYLALAVSGSCPLVTADLRLYNALRTVPDFDLVWVGDVLRRESMAVLVLFQRPCEEERMTAELARQLATLLREGQSRPS